MDFLVYTFFFTLVLTKVNLWEMVRRGLWAAVLSWSAYRLHYCINCNVKAMNVLSVVDQQSTNNKKQWVTSTNIAIHKKLTYNYTLRHGKIDRIPGKGLRGHSSTRHLKWHKGHNWFQISLWQLNRKHEQCQLFRNVVAAQGCTGWFNCCPPPPTTYFNTLYPHYRTYPILSNMVWV